MSRTSHCGIPSVPSSTVSAAALSLRTPSSVTSQGGSGLRQRPQKRERKRLFPPEMGLNVAKVGQCILFMNDPHEQSFTLEFT